MSFICAALSALATAFVVAYLWLSSIGGDDNRGV